LDRFKPLLDIEEDKFKKLIKSNGLGIKGLDFEVRLLRRLPKAYRDKYSYEKRGDEKIRRAHLIIDFLSGMTDDFCLDMYQVLEGIKVK
jgi:dGTPase